MVQERVGASGGAGGGNGVGKWLVEPWWRLGEEEMFGGLLSGDYY